MSPKTPQSVFLEEAEAMPVESVQLKLRLSNNQVRRFDKEAIKAVSMDTHGFLIVIL